MFEEGRWDRRRWRRVRNAVCIVLRPKRKREENEEQSEAGACKRMCPQHLGEVHAAKAFAGGARALRLCGTVQHPVNSESFGVSRPGTTTFLPSIRVTGRSVLCLTQRERRVWLSLTYQVRRKTRTFL